MATLEYYDSLIQRVDTVVDCSQLTELTLEINLIFDDALASITESLNALIPLLVVPSADFGAIITWIQSMIDTLVLPQQNLLLLQAETIAKQIEAVAALAAKASEIGC